MQITWKTFIEDRLNLFLQYIGSFSVIGEEQNSRAEYVRKQLADMRVSDVIIIHHTAGRISRHNQQQVTFYIRF